MAEIAMRSKPVRRRPDNRVIGAAATVAAGLVAIALIFATSGLVGPDSRSQGGSGGGAPRYVSFAAPHRG
jgi:hypothetical protein